MSAGRYEIVKRVRTKEREEASRDISNSPGGLSAPAPRNHGSTTCVSSAAGHSPFSICGAWNQPMPRLGAPHPTRIVSVSAAMRAVDDERRAALLARRGANPRTPLSARSARSVVGMESQLHREHEVDPQDLSKFSERGCAGGIAFKGEGAL